MAKRTFGCSSIINAVNLQFYLAGHGVYTDLKRAQGGLWLCEHAILRPVVPDTVTVGLPNAQTPFKRQWDAQAPRSLSWPKSIS